MNNTFIRPVLRKASDKRPRAPVSRILTQTLIRSQAVKSPKSYLDSGASQHIVTDISILDNVELSVWNGDLSKISGCVSDSVVQIMGYGTIPKVGNTFYASGKVANTLSVSQLDRNGFTITFDGGSFTSVSTLNGDEKQIVAEAYNNRYVADISVRGLRSGKPEVTQPSKDILAYCYVLSVE